ncbi:TM0996/MTH895 family glutaredoxin-like protein [Methanococcoides orientis]|uniref:thioredoxin family protein n=1 Tax=Methanococcoides orientis TaxID=2822137 RepID=UPI001E3374FE|nr:thioredoxin family protein [Methanococcoides orientis]UGV41208.1 TM0996/MTH895 family glutaredoxin-like protein [Methanococcoides orientis]
MKIEILGTGCAKCVKTKEVVEKVLQESGLQADVVKVEDFETILSYGIMITPGLVIDGEVMVAGRVPSEDNVRKWING